MRCVSYGPHAVEVTLEADAKNQSSQRFLRNVILCFVLLACIFIPLPSFFFETMAVSASDTIRLGLCSPWTVSSTGIMASACYIHLGEWLPILFSALFRFSLAIITSIVLPHPIIQESLLALRGVGIQTRTLRSTGAVVCKLYDASSLREIIIHEGVQTCHVRFYLALVVSDSKNLSLAFDTSRPRLPILSRIYRTIHPVMFPDKHLNDDIYESFSWNNADGFKG